MEPIRLLWAVSVAFSLISLWCYWRFAGNLPSKTVNRLGGIKDKDSRLLYELLLVAGGYYLFDLVSAWHSFPVWADGIAIVVLLLSGVFVIRQLKRNPKFNLAKIRKVWLAPLGISCVGVSVLAKVGDQTPAVAAKVSTVVSATAVGKSVENAAAVVAATVTKTLGKKRIPGGILTETLEGVILFRNTLEKGSIGDRVAHKLFGAMQYTHHRSKFKGNKGFDGVYAYTDKSGQQHIYLVENKIKGASLARDQMSDSWVAKKLEEMNEYGDKDVRETAAMIEKALSSASNVVVHKALVEHNLHTGLATCFDITSEGVKATIRWEKQCEKIMRQVLREYKDKLAKIASQVRDQMPEVVPALSP